MTAARIDSEVNYVQSPSVVQLSLLASAVLAASPPPPKAAPRGSKVIAFTHQAPKLDAPASSSEAPPRVTDFLAALWAYMNDILGNAVAMNQNQANISKTEVNIGQAFEKNAEAQLTTAQTDLQKYISAEQSASEWGTFFKWLSVAVGALMFIIGTATCNPQLIMMGASGVVMGAWGGQAVSDALGNCPLGEKIGVLVAIAVVIAVISCGIGGLIGGAPAVAADAAGGAGAAGGAAGGAGAGAAGADAAAAGADAAAEDSSFTTRLSQVWQKGFANGAKGVQYGNFFSAFGQAALVVNPYSDIVLAMMQGLNAIVKAASDGKDSISSDVQNMVAQICGMIAALVGAFVGGACSSEGALGGTASGTFSNAVGDAETADKIIKGMKVAMYLAGLTAACFSVAAGKAQLDAAVYPEQTAAFEAQMGVFQYLTDSMNRTIRNGQKTISAYNQVESQISSRWNQYAQMYSADLMG